MNLFTSGSHSRREAGAWKVVSTLSAILGGVLTRKVLEKVWKAVRSDSAAEPPLNPADRRNSWADALMWAISAGIGAGLGRLVSERVAAAGWERATGRTPPGVEA